MAQVPAEHREEIANLIEYYVDEDKVSAEFTAQRLVWIENLIKLKQALERYLRPLICLGFNSARYDLKIIAPYMIPVMLGEEAGVFYERCLPLLYSPPLDWHGQWHALGDYSHLQPEVLPDPGDINVIKQHGGYTVFSWGSLIEFKDVYKFCSPNTNLASFMKMHGAEEAKGFFPYQWLTSWDKLAQDHLPPVEEFATGLVEGESVLGATEEQIAENYAELQQVWRDKDMQTMHDFLQWYNMLDVVPFAQAIKGWLAPYHKTVPHPTLFTDEGVYMRDPLEGVDILKTCVSEPGVAQSLMNHHVAREPGFQGLYLFHNKEQDLVHLFRDNITGGPSIVFNRQVVPDEGEEELSGYVLTGNAYWAGYTLPAQATGRGGRGPIVY